MLQTRRCLLVRFADLCRGNRVFATVLRVSLVEVDTHRVKLFGKSVNRTWIKHWQLYLFDKYYNSSSLFRNFGNDLLDSPDFRGSQISSVFLIESTNHVSLQ